MVDTVQHASQQLLSRVYVLDLRDNDHGSNRRTSFRISTCTSGFLGPLAFWNTSNNLLLVEIYPRRTISLQPLLQID